MNRVPEAKPVNLDFLLFCAMMANISVSIRDAIRCVCVPVGLPQFSVTPLVSDEDRRLLTAAGSNANKIIVHCVIIFAMKRIVHLSLKVKIYPSTKRYVDVCICYFKPIICYVFIFYLFSHCSMFVICEDIKINVCLVAKRQSTKFEQLFISNNNSNIYIHCIYSKYTYYILFAQ